MDRISEFYTKAMADDFMKNEFARILAGRNIEEASDEQLMKIGELAKKLGVEISLEEARDYFRAGDAELGEDELDAVAGGKGETHEKILYVCAVGGQAGVDNDNFGEGAEQRVHGPK